MQKAIICTFGFGIFVCKAVDSCFVDHFSIKETAFDGETLVAVSKLLKNSCSCSIIVCAHSDSGSTFKHVLHLGKACVISSKTWS